MTFRNIEDESIMVGGPFLHLRVEGSRFWANCTGIIDNRLIHHKNPVDFSGSTHGIVFRPTSGNLSISDTELGSFDHHALDVEGKDTSVALL